jgi:hypothetical protein
MNVIKVTRFSPWEEHALRLSDLAEDESFLIAMGGKVRLCLPLYLKNDLAKCLGMRISILRTDTDYRFRILEDQS